MSSPTVLDTGARACGEAAIVRVGRPETQPISARAIVTLACEANLEAFDRTI